MKRTISYKNTPKASFDYESTAYQHIYPPGVLRGYKLKPIRKEEGKEEKNERKEEKEEKEREEEKEETYIFTTNVNKSLSQILGIPEFKNEDEQFIWKPPKESGLSNSNYIIEPYYQLHKDINKIYDIDYFGIIKDDIRNLRKLNTYQLNFIKELPEECKDELLEIYNGCMNSMIDGILS